MSGQPLQRPDALRQVDRRAAVARGGAQLREVIGDDASLAGQTVGDQIAAANRHQRLGPGEPGANLAEAGEACDHLAAGIEQLEAQSRGRLPRRAHHGGQVGKTLGVKRQHQAVLARDASDCRQGCAAADALSLREPVTTTAGNR